MKVLKHADKYKTVAVEIQLQDGDPIRIINMVLANDLRERLNDIFDDGGICEGCDDFREPDDRKLTDDDVWLCPACWEELIADSAPNKTKES